MGDEYSFDHAGFSIPMETRVLVADGNGGWQSEEHSEHYETVEDGTLSDTINDGYMTADDGGENATQYFSVLETSSETILNDMSQISLDVTRNEGDFDVTLEENEESQDENPEVVFFRVDGSDELYGIQLGQDEQGNLQKYQFQVRQNENGQLEIIPETIQIVPFNNGEELQENTEDNATEEAPQIPEKEEAEQESHPTIFIKQEEFVDEDSVESEVDKNYRDTVEELEVHSDSEMDIKEGILRQVAVNNEDLIQNHLEVQEEQEEYVEEEEVDANEGEFVPFQQIYLNEEHEQVEEAHEEFVEKAMVHHEDEEDEETQRIVDSKVQMYFTVPQDEESLPSQPSDFMNEDSDNENDSDDCADELHVSGDDNLKFVINQRYLKSKILSIESQNDLITDTALRNTNRIMKKNNRNPCSLLIKNVEKENMATSAVNTLKRINPRSVLKTSVIELEEKSEHEYDKRFAKGKVAVQARQFQNYISQTKILEAPVRQERLPRKQTIKPLVRSGEEIIVQEVVVSSNGFIETREDGVLRERKALIPTECIHLSDSEDSTSGRKKRKRSKKSKQIEIVISDSEDEENGEVILVDVKRLDHKCGKCPKSFPSEGSLRSHMQYHNYSEKTTEVSTDVDNLKSIVEEDANLQDKETLSKPSKYKCDKCNEQFKNQILLNKHNDLHRSSVKFECNHCKKIFVDRVHLINHRRTHVKTQMFRNTTPLEISPKKTKLPVLQTKLLKCKDCDKVFTSAILLSAHLKCHKRFTCLNCGGLFTSKYVFDNHVLRSCVKSPIRRKISPRKSIFRCPSKVPRPSIVQKTNDDHSFLAPRAAPMVVKCDSCDSIFHSHRNLLKHKVLVHKLNTPDKSIGREQARTLHYKERGEHSGIPTMNKMNNAFAGLRNKLNK